ncbi:hypothetical protein BU23DRAFT_637141 [Bimuria novae-zelandiae CBS 107.79]|uniref:RapZ C-terminal domain-containing protein n=1 Tax=Bimuria novae-zelandiae CBS 107.79 TaxID=1447943 RepID=A0A6A5VRD7_9PLEO|nr:hypothetical protein BU23DRAFT_637141 [Bimuria novae-zelandiae CBS 107.79]
MGSKRDDLYHRHVSRLPSLTQRADLGYHARIPPASSTLPRSSSSRFLAILPSPIDLTLSSSHKRTSRPRGSEMQRHDLQRGHSLPPRWPAHARYAPGYPVYEYPTTAHATMFFPKPQESHIRTGPAPRPIPTQSHHRASILKKQVHFSPRPSPVGTPCEQNIHQNPSMSDFHKASRTPPAHHLPRKPSHHDLRQHERRHTEPTYPVLPQNIGHKGRPSPQEPTIYIITYAHSLTRHDSAVDKILANELPPGTPHLYTIRAYDFTPPPAHICDAYSGISPIVQEYVMRDIRARNAVSDAIENILAYGRRQLKKEHEGKRPVRDVAISVCCMQGTHRSVSIAEKIGQGLMGMRLGVRVIVRHMHRVRGSREAR